jgi:four helix bundle protein
MQNAKCKMKNEEASAGDGSDWDALEERLLDFGARVGLVVDALPETRMGRHVAGQLVRCGTSAAPNDAEGCAAESRADFIHKLRIVLKELRETRIWLRLIVKSKLLPIAKLNALIDECIQLMNIIGKSIVTAKSNAKNERRR